MNYSQGRQSAVYRRDMEFIQGNTARRIAERPEKREQIRKVSDRTLKNRAKARYMNLGYVVFLSMAVLIVSAMLISYLQLQSELTLTRKNVAAMESELDYLRSSNDEAFKRVNSAVSLDEIKRIAVEELGMTYAKEGQVIVIQDTGSDYVRQVKALN